MNVTCLCMLYDVLTWVVHGGELYVLIIIIHGMLMLHVALIYIHVTRRKKCIDIIALHVHENIA